MHRNQVVKKFRLSADMKLVLVIFLVLSIGFLSLYIFSELNYQLEAFGKIWELEDKFFSQNFKDKTTVFILGSSHVLSLEPYDIENKLSESGLLVDVYNLGILADTPQKRILSIDKIISAKPDLVLYGVGFRDFAESSSTNNPGISQFSTDGVEAILPDPHDTIYFELGLNRYFNENFGHLKSSKITTLNFFQNIPKNNFDDVNNNSNEEFSEKIPFTNYKQKIKNIASKQELQNQVGALPWNGFEPTDYNFQELTRIIKILQNNKINVIIFSTPHSNEYLSTIPEEEQQFFLSKLNDFKNSDVPVYHFYDDYKDMDVWHDFTHVTMEKQGMTYIDDITELILKTM